MLWALLLATSLFMGSILHLLSFPAAFLIGAMLAGIAFSTRGTRLVLPRKLFVCAQALIGCSVANSINADILVTIAGNWWIMILIVTSTILAGALVGWLLTRSQALPGTTAAWGSTPGAAAAMVSMAEHYGADFRLVALMQYLRVFVVILSASSVAHYLISGVSLVPDETTITPSILAFGDVPPLLSGLAVAITGGWIGQRLRIPAGALLVPMLLGAIVHSGGIAEIRQPFWLQAIAALWLGWYVGLGFNRRFLTNAIGILPQLLFSAILLIGFCLIPAWLLVYTLQIDPLTAYLSTSPGGLDSLVLIAMSSRADVPFVVAVQTLRLFLVILTGPFIARFISKHAPPDNSED